MPNELHGQNESAVFILDLLDLKNEINQPQIKALLEKGYEKSIDIAVQDEGDPKLILVLTKGYQSKQMDKLSTQVEALILFSKYYLFVFSIFSLFFLINKFY
tara:strand:+ start:126 stop:431 length:306 start_codon:yes stop_codon:yes gene_type:complete